MTRQSSLNSPTDLQILSEAAAAGRFAVELLSIVLSALFDQSASLERRTRCMFRVRSAAINRACLSRSTHNAARNIQGLVRW